MQPDSNDIIYNEYGVDLFAVLEYLLNGILSTGITTNDIIDFLSNAWDIFSFVSLTLSALFIVGIIYSYLQINKYLGLINGKILLAEEAWREMHGGRGTDNRWQEVLRHVSSERPNDWRLAIIEADIMLGEALTERGYAGLTIGDQLKGISVTQMVTLQDAWDAHRIRNRIAHEGSDFVLTQSTAREAIVKFERALRELGFI